MAFELTAKCSAPPVLPTNSIRPVEVVPACRVVVMVPGVAVRVTGAPTVRVTGTVRRPDGDVDEMVMLPLYVPGGRVVKFAMATLREPGAVPELV